MVWYAMVCYGIVRYAMVWYIFKNRIDFIVINDNIGVTSRKIKGKNSYLAMFLINDSNFVAIRQNMFIISYNVLCYL